MQVEIDLNSTLVKPMLPQLLRKEMADECWQIDLLTTNGLSSFTRISPMRRTLHGAGSFEDCDIYNNGFSGVWIRTGSNPTIRNTKINRNDGVAVLTEQNSAGSVLNCDLILDKL